MTDSKREVYCPTCSRRTPSVPEAPEPAVLLNDWNEVATWLLSCGWYLPAFVRGRIARLRGEPPVSIEAPEPAKASGWVPTLALNPYPNDGTTAWLDIGGSIDPFVATWAIGHWWRVNSRGEMTGLRMGHVIRFWPLPAPPDSEGK